MEKQQSSPDQRDSTPKHTDEEKGEGGGLQPPAGQQNGQIGDDLELTQIPSLVLSNGVPDSSPNNAAPEGGLVAWMAVAACFLTIMNTWGMIISFGVFQTYYVSVLDRDRSDIAWIGSLSVFQLFFFGVVSGRLMDAGYFRHITAVGAFLVVFGTMMTSLGTTYWQIILSHGVCTGLGNGFLLTPMMTLIATYFQRRLPLVFGIAACGSVTGGLIYPSMARTLLPSVGFPWTMRAIGFIQLGTFAVALAVARPRQAVRKSGPIIDLTVFKEPQFSLYLFGCFLAFIGVFFPFFFLSSFARENLGMGYEDALDLTLVLNGIGFVGRLLPSLLARYLGTFNVFIGFLWCTSLCMFTWIPVHDTAGLYVWTTFYSLSVGGVQSLFLAVVPIINSDMDSLGARLGIISAAVGIGALIGSPVSGAIISSNDGSYTGAQIFSGCVLAVGGLLALGARDVRRRQKGGGMMLKI